MRSLFDSIPGWLVGPLSFAAVAAAAIATGLMLLATIYGDATPALWAGGVFGLAGLLWLSADHAADHRQDS